MSNYKNIKNDMHNDEILPYVNTYIDENTRNNIILALDLYITAKKTIYKKYRCSVCVKYNPCRTCEGHRYSIRALEYALKYTESIKHEEGELTLYSPGIAYLHSRR